MYMQLKKEPSNLLGERVWIIPFPIANGEQGCDAVGIASNPSDQNPYTTGSTGRGLWSLKPSKMP